MHYQINEHNPDARQIEKIKKMLEAGAIIIYPTDSIYGMGCDPLSKIGVEKLVKLAEVNPTQKSLTFVCSSISMASEYTTQISNSTFRFIKNLIPGPYTFILAASNAIPKVLASKKKTFGFRIPDNRIALSIINSLGRPLLSTSLKNYVEEENEDTKYYVQPERIYEDYHHLVDLVIDGGIGSIEESTVIDFTTDEAIILRKGKGWENINFDQN